MRKYLLITVLVVTTGNSAFAGMPYFHGADKGAANTPQQSSSGWKFPRLWGKKNATPDPQFFYQAPAEQPTTTERISSAITGNAAVSTARTWMTPNANAATQPNSQDAISLNQTPGKPTPSLLLSMAQVREQQGDTAGARPMYQQALAADPKNVKTLRELGHFEDRQNQLASAERYYAEAAKLSPQEPAVLNDLALCLARQGKTGPSSQILSQAIQLAPKKSLYRNNMATVLMELGDQHQAMQHLLAAHAPAAAYYNMGHLLEKGNQLEAAAAHYAEALRIDPAMNPAQSAIARLEHSLPAAVPQTALAPAAAEPTPAAQQAWPSEPIAPATPATSSHEPDFGPRLLPPVQ